MMFPTTIIIIIMIMIMIIITIIIITYNNIRQAALGGVGKRLSREETSTGNYGNLHSQGFLPGVEARCLLPRACASATE